MASCARAAMRVPGSACMTLLASVLLIGRAIAQPPPAGDHSLYDTAGEDPF